MYLGSKSESVGLSQLKTDKGLLDEMLDAVW